LCLQKLLKFGHDMLKLNNKKVLVVTIGPSE